MRNRFIGATMAALLLAVSCQDSGQPTQPDAGIPALSRQDNQDRPVYIVTFKTDVRDTPGLARQLAATGGSAPLYVYTNALRGFAAPFSPQAAAALLNNPNVESVELDQIVTADATQFGAPWGLDRIDQRDGLSTTYVYNATGAGVDVYIIDTGILTAHTQFGGRASAGFSAIGGGAQDCNGHGTHVAGTVGGSTYGVAKAVSLIAVRVLDCNGSGTTSGVINGIDWVVGVANGPSVANMSLSGGASNSLDNAVNNAVNSGIVFAVAAGNNGRDACRFSPARAEFALTVGATTSSDSRASYSNYGSCVDLFAPGSGITSAWIGSNTATNTINGTSMASPHVAGVAALYLQNNTSATPATVATAILSNATANRLSSIGKDSPNLLLYMAFIGGPSGENVAPTARFTAPSCLVNVACSFDGSASTDSDGSILSYAWTFSSGGSASGVSPSHTFTAIGTVSVTLTVTDNQGATGSTTHDVSVSDAPPPATITLDGSSSTRGRNYFVELNWTGSSGVFTVFRDGGVIATTSNSSYSENVGKTAGGSANYQVCDAAGSCSNIVNVTW